MAITEAQRVTRRDGSLYFRLMVDDVERWEEEFWNVEVAPGAVLDYRRLQSAILAASGRVYFDEVAETGPAGLVDWRRRMARLVEAASAWREHPRGWLEEVPVLLPPVPNEN
ncbi:MAG: hypothetical protein HY329_06925 [Chloroflexi bacterium]|nr:hypothetical protein [Chloroflexota bacterium]